MSVLKIAEVVETKMAYKSNQKDAEGNILPLGTIQIRLAGDETLLNQVRNEYASPALFNRRIPLIGEQVMIISAPKTVISGKRIKKIGYLYLMPYNAIDNVTIHQLPKLFDRERIHKGSLNASPRLADDEEVGYTFEKNPTKAKHLQPFEGDDLWEGRFGQSIRLSRHLEQSNSPGTGIYEKQPTWKGKKKNDPIILIRVKAPKGGNGYDVEDLAEDASSIYLTTSHKLTKFKAGFNKNKDVKQVPTWQKGGQIIVNSDRVTINAKDDKLLLIGKTDAILTAEKIRFQTKKYNVDFDDLMDYIDDCFAELFKLTTVQATFTTYMGPTGIATNASTVTKLHKVTFPMKFKQP